MRFRLRTLMIVLALVCADCAYVRLYLASVAYIETDGAFTFWFYDQTWQVTAFKPAAWFESLATGRHVFTGESETLWRANHPGPIENYRLKIQR